MRAIHLHLCFSWKLESACLQVDPKLLLLPFIFIHRIKRFFWLTSLHTLSNITYLYYSTLPGRNPGLHSKSLNITTHITAVCLTGILHNVCVEKCPRLLSYLPWLLVNVFRRGDIFFFTPCIWLSWRADGVVSKLPIKKGRVATTSSSSLCPFSCCTFTLLLSLSPCALLFSLQLCLFLPLPSALQWQDDTGKMCGLLNRLGVTYVRRGGTWEGNQECVPQQACSMCMHVCWLPPTFRCEPWCAGPYTWSSPGNV